MAFLRLISFSFDIPLALTGHVRARARIVYMS
jgi:hypothetical protein